MTAVILRMTPVRFNLTAVILTVTPVSSRMISVSRRVTESAVYRPAATVSFSAGASGRTSTP